MDVNVGVCRHLMRKMVMMMVCVCVCQREREMPLLPKAWLSEAAGMKSTLRLWPFSCLSYISSFNEIRIQREGEGGPLSTLLLFCDIQ